MDLKARHVLFPRLAATCLIGRGVEKAVAAMSDMSSLQDMILRDFWGLDKAVHETVKPRKYVDAYGVRSDSLAEDKVVYEYKKRPKFLCHYTSRDLAVKILAKVIDSKRNGVTSCALGFTDYRFLNDDQEFRFGLDIAKIWLAHNAENTLSGKFREKLLSLFDSMDLTQVYTPYVLSFSQYDDSTVHWAAYTDKEDGGYSLSFSFGKVAKTVANYTKIVRERDADVTLRYVSLPVFLSPCIYCATRDLKQWKRSKRLPEKIVSFLDALLPQVDESMFEKFDFGKQIDNVTRWCAERLFYFASVVKSDEFSFEKEWRLVVRKELNPAGNNLDGNVIIIGGKPRIIPEQFDLDGCLKALVVSPQGDVPRLKLLGEIMVKQISDKIKVKLSTSSYNGR